MNKKRQRGLAVRRRAAAVAPDPRGQEKAAVGTKICAQLLRKVQEDLRVACQGEQAGDFRHLVDASSAGGSGDLGALLGHSVRTRLYFTSESHLHGLLNALAHHGGGGGGSSSSGGRLRRAGAPPARGLRKWTIVIAP